MRAERNIKDISPALTRDRQIYVYPSLALVAVLCC